ncbi:CrcB family protein [Nocardioides sp.]|uniref:fluoride efflux transporter FluC n=1 Tax=Nocardioides sp. TaxID=35761 RepID=UPI00271F4128|nr:CrcB family protein [Nocardioides sp.]MDO9455046.1 CrcB family protein [Nocardioides sp.]
MTVLLVALGAAVGAPLRFLVASRLDDRLRAVALGTLAVNVAGSFVLGALSGAAVDGAALALLGTGFCGGLTTYSAFAVQTAERGRWGPAYAAVTVLGSLAACALGFWVAR